MEGRRESALHLFFYMVSSQRNRAIYAHNLIDMLYLWPEYN